MEMDCTSVCWLNDFLIHISYGDIKTVYVNPVNSNIIGAYAPYYVSENMIKNLLIAKIKDKGVAPFQYSLRPFFNYKDNFPIYIWGNPYLLKLISQKIIIYKYLTQKKLYM